VGLDLPVESGIRVFDNEEELTLQEGACEPNPSNIEGADGQGVADIHIFDDNEYVDLLMGENAPTTATSTAESNVEDDTIYPPAPAEFTTMDPYDNNNDDESGRRFEKYPRG